MSEATQIVAIDGPAGAGKSSSAKRAAQALGFAFLDTGAMYRAATWRALNHGLDLDDAQALLRSTEEMQLDIQETGGGQRVLVDGIDVTEAIRTPEITRVIYKLDQNSGVRRHLVSQQRALGEKAPSVAEGRDIGTVVFPKSKCKIYLDASPEERAQRRAQQMREKGLEVNLEQLRAEILERDEMNKTRNDSPLRPAEDAVLLDSTNMNLDQVVEDIVRMAREKL